MNTGESNSSYHNCNDKDLKKAETNQYSACKKATAMVFTSGYRGYPAVHFEYKTASERYLVAEL